MSKTMDVNKERLDKAMNLLGRAVGYEAIPPDREWWKDYFTLTGEHMVLIEDSGWITAANYQQIDDQDKPRILDEIKPPNQ